MHTVKENAEAHFCHTFSVCMYVCVSVCITNFLCLMLRRTDCSSIELRNFVTELILLLAGNVADAPNLFSEHSLCSTFPVGPFIGSSTRSTRNIYLDLARGYG